MSGRRTKQLRKECTERLGRAPLKADGHVAMRSTVVERQHGGRTILARAVALLKRKKRVQSDEFRFFKRNGCTPAERAQAQRYLVAARQRHAEDVELNNEHMADLRRQRAAEVAA